MTVEEAKKAFEELKAQGETDNDILVVLYQMYQEDDFSLEELESFANILGYEFSDEFKAMSDEDKKTKGVKYSDEEQDVNCGNDLQGTMNTGKSKTDSSGQNCYNYKRHIKEISIEFKCDRYNGILRMSDGWTSYRDIVRKDGMTKVSWSYKNSDRNSDNFDKLFAIKNSVQDLLENKKAKSAEHKAKKRYNIRMTYEDNTYLELSQNGCLSDNGLSYLAFQIVSLIPENEDYPDMLCMFEKKELTKEALREINPESVVAYVNNQFFCAYDEVVTTDGKGNFKLYSTEKVDDRPDISGILNGLDECEMRFGRPFGDVIDLKGHSWIFLYLGDENFMFLDQKFAEVLNTMIFDARLGNRLYKWDRLSCPKRPIL